MTGVAASGDTSLGDAKAKAAEDTGTSSSDADRLMLWSGLSDGTIVDIVLFVLSVEEVTDDTDRNPACQTTVSLSWSERPEGGRGAVGEVEPERAEATVTRVVAHAPGRRFDADVLHLL